MLTPATRSLTAYFPILLRRLRQTRDLTQRELAARAGLRQQYVHLLERGMQPYRLEHVDALARALEVEVLDLLGLTTAPDATARATEQP